MAINYSAMLAQLDLSPLMEGFRQRQQARQQEAAQALDREKYNYAVSQDAAANRRRDAFNNAYRDAIMAPSQAKFDGLRANFPDFHEPIDAGWKSYSDGQRQNMVSTAGSFVAALTNNKPDIALHALERRRSALVAGDIDTTETDSLIGMVKSGDPVQIKAARGIGAMILAQAAGDKFDTVWAHLNKVDNDEEVQGDRVRAAAADADYKEARARYEPAKAQATIGRANASAADAQSRKARRDSLPARRTAGASSPPPPQRGSSQPARRQPTATGPDGKKYVVRGGKWVPAS